MCLAVLTGKDGGPAVGEATDKGVIFIRLETADMHPRQQVIDGIRGELIGSIRMRPGREDSPGSSVREVRARRAIGRRPLE